MLVFTLVFYFITVFPKWFIGINSCSMWTHEGNKSAFSISHKEDQRMMLNYLSVRVVFDREKRDVLKSLCYVLKCPWFPYFSLYFPFPFPFSSLPFFLLSLCCWAADILYLPPFFPSQIEADLCKTDYRLCEVKTVLSALTVEREQTIQASFNHSISPEGEKQVRQHLM